MAVLAFLCNGLLHHLVNKPRVNPMFILILGSCRIPYFKMCLFDTIIHSISLGFIRDKHWGTEVEEQILLWTLSSQTKRTEIRHAWFLLQPFRYNYGGGFHFWFVYSNENYVMNLIPENIPKYLVELWNWEVQTALKNNAIAELCKIFSVIQPKVPNYVWISA